MNTESFKNFVPKLFQSAEEKEKRALEKIERQRRQREHEMSIALRFAGLTDAVEVARENFAKQCRTLDEASEFSSEQFAQLYLNGQKVEDLALRLCGTEKLKMTLPKIKAELQRLIVGTAEKTLADFRQANREILSKLPKLERAAENFTPTTPTDDFDRTPNLPSAGVRQMLDLKPGETLPPIFEPKGDGKIRDLDPD